MAARAVRAYLTAMLIRVAAQTITRKAQVRAVQVFGLNPHTRGRRNVRGLVTFLAGHSRVLPFERITCLTVVERFAVRLPVDEGKILSVMIGMAARAFLARRIRPNKGCVQAAPVGNAVANFRVAFETL